MSLITEALKKARQEAARQEALKQGSAYPWMAGPTTPPRSQTRSALLIGVLAGCLAAGLGTAGAVWWLSGRMAPPQPAPAAAPAAEIAQTAERAPVPAPATEPPPQIIEEEAPVTREEAAPIQETPPPAPPVRPVEPAPAPVQPAPARPAPVETPAPTPAAPVVPEPTPQPAAPAPDPEAAAAAAAGLEDGKTYVREVPVPGGGSLKLNGIAFSENPVALFSDRVVAPGESIGGFKVVGMDVKQVTLEGHGVKVYVALK